MLVNQLRRIYLDGLLNDTLRFWFPRSVDKEYGGFLTCFDRDGTLLQTDKAVWLQGRMSWLTATLYSTIERRAEWLEWSKHGIDFLNAHAFDQDGRMFFLLTRDGRPLRKRRYIFSECFTVMALAAYSIAAGDPAFARQALSLFHLVLRYLRTPGLLPPKVNPDVRPLKGLAIPMILIVTAQELRKAVNDPVCDRTIAVSISEIEKDFVKPQFRCVLENVGPNGEVYDTFDGRLINPGHAIEAGWFILEEARLRGKDPRLIRLGTRIIDWSFERGWDNEFGGLFYYRDSAGRPSSEYWHDMKFWWPHNEAIIGTLLAYELTGQAKYARWHAELHDWAYTHFADPTYGEWYGYLHRDGTISTPIKGNIWKGAFHLPRMQWYCAHRLAAMGKK